MRQKEFYVDVARDEASSLLFLQDFGILEKVEQAKCKRCQGRLVQKFRMSGKIEKPIWKCTKSTCRAQQSARRGCAFFQYEDSIGRIRNKLGLHEVLELVWLFATSTATSRNISNLTGRSKSTVTDWYNMCKETCGKALSIRDKLIGTHDRPVQVDEAYFSGRRKNGRGRKMHGDDEEDEDSAVLITNDDELPENADENQDDYVQFGIDKRSWRWVVGIYQAPNSVVFERVPNRSAKTLSAVIDKYVARGSEIHSDQWSGYNCLSSLGFIHKTVNHSTNFVDPISGAHTQGVERAWIEAKMWLKRSRGNRTLLQSHLDEAAWRILHKEDEQKGEIFEALLSDIKLVHCYVS